MRRTTRPFITLCHSGYNDTKTKILGAIPRIVLCFIYYTNLLNTAEKSMPSSGKSTIGISGRKSVGVGRGTQ